MRCHPISISFQQIYASEIIVSLRSSQSLHAQCDHDSIRYYCIIVAVKRNACKFKLANKWIDVRLPIGDSTSIGSLRCCKQNKKRTEKNIRPNCVFFYVNVSIFHHKQERRTCDRNEIFCCWIHKTKSMNFRIFIFVRRSPTHFLFCCAFLWVRASFPWFMFCRYSFGTHIIVDCRSEQKSKINAANWKLADTADVYWCGGRHSHSHDKLESILWKTICLRNFHLVLLDVYRLHYFLVSTVTYNKFVDCFALFAIIVRCRSMRRRCEWNK